MVLTVPRQSGKTTLLLVLILLRALDGGGTTIKYTAQHGAAARGKLIDDWLPALKASAFNRYFTRLTSGHEALLFGNGSSLGLVATTQKSGHGATIDLAILDEAFAHPDARVEQAVRPAMMTRRALWSFRPPPCPTSAPICSARLRRAASWSRPA